MDYLNRKQQLYSQLEEQSKELKVANKKPVKRQVASVREISLNKETLDYSIKQNCRRPKKTKNNNNLDLFGSTQSSALLFKSINEQLKDPKKTLRKIETANDKSLNNSKVKTTHQTRLRRYLTKENQVLDQKRTTRKLKGGPVMVSLQ